MYGGIEIKDNIKMLNEIRFKKWSVFNILYFTKITIFIKLDMLLDTFFSSIKKEKK